jgi:hypothetical protein
VWINTYTLPASAVAVRHFVDPDKANDYDSDYDYDYDDYNCNCDYDYDSDYEPAKIIRESRCRNLWAYN